MPDLRSIRHGSMLVLGGGGFIGRHVLIEAVRRGWHVKALARTDRSAELVAAAGATVLRGSMEDARFLAGEFEGVSAVLDLVQPPFAKRIGRRQLNELSATRQRYTSRLLEVMTTLSPDRRPALISVSGIDDLDLDPEGRFSARSPLTGRTYGLNAIGIPVRRLIERADVAASFVYFGTVYGPGKAFAETIFPQLAAGKWKNFALDTERMVLTHVEDAAEALVTVAESVGTSRGRTFVRTDHCPVRMETFFAHAAQLMEVDLPSRIPHWLAELAVGRALVQTMLTDRHVERGSSSGDVVHLKYPSYREGLSATLRVLGYPQKT